MPIQNSWVLTDLGAFNFLKMQQIIENQQAQINALIAQVQGLQLKGRSVPGLLNTTNPHR